MEKYIRYKLEDFLLDDSFRAWVHAGAVLHGSVWGDLLQRYPEKKEVVEKAIVLVKEWKRPSSSLSDEQMYRDIDAILTDISREKTIRRPLWYRWTGYAAVALLTLGIAGYFFTSRPLDTQDTATAIHGPSPIEVFNSGQADQVISLPDGSSVRLSPGSRVTYSAEFADEAMRNVNLTGEAFFDVRRDTLRPFSVYTGDLTTRVLGTSFTVRSGGKDISVTVNTGKVAVSKSGEESEPLVLTPNQKAVYRSSEQTLIKTLAEAPVIVDQEELKGRFVFDEEPAGNIFRALEKAYGIAIQFNPAALKDCYVTLPLGEEPFYQKLAVLCRTIKATYQVTDEGIWIESEGCQ